MQRVELVRRLLAIALFLVLPAMGQTIFNCSSGFTTTSGSCSVNWPGYGSLAFSVVGAFNGTTPVMSGSTMVLAPSGSDHTGNGLIYQTPVNVQAFTSRFTFVPNGQNITFTVENNNRPNGGGGGNPKGFAGGAGCEAGIYQAFGTSPTSANNIFALKLDSYSPLTESGSFSYSSAQVYQTFQSPCLPDDGGPNFWPTNQISTSPVPLNSPAGAQNTSTGDTYSATVTYDGTNFTLNLYDVTAGGSCPGSKCFTQTWSAVDIPSLVDGNTAYVGLTEGTGESSGYPLYIESFSYTVNSPPATPSLSTYTTQSYMSGTTPAANPTFSPAAGSYSGSQNVTISCSTGGSNICYTPASSIPSILPQTDNMGGCQSGTAYSGAVTVSSSQTIYAMCGTAFGGLPSNLIASAYTIGGSPASSMPTFSPAGGTYTSAQSVTLSDATSGATIYYTTNGSTPTTSSTVYTGPITVSSTETLEAIAVATGDTNSGVASAAFTISVPVVATPTFSPAAGTYTSAQSVTISDATSGATIYYTTNGSTPTTSSTVYTGPITVSATETLEAIAVAAGDTNSGVASAAYTISVPVVSTPTFSPPGGRIPPRSR